MTQRETEEIPMLEDFRGHDPNPTVNEVAWMETDLLPVVLRLVALASLAVVIALTLSQTLDSDQPPAPAAMASTR
jgi:hypothetical protein